jgi:uncharacterized protein
MIKKHSIIWFYIFTLIVTVVLGGVAQGFLVKLFSEQYHTILTLVMVQMAPTLGTLLICLWTKDRGCFKNMNWRPAKSIKSILWLLLSFIIPAAIVAAAALVMSALGKTYIPNGYSTNLLIITVFGALIGCIGEEIGWRGFMQPAFNKKYSLFRSGVFTGILWGAWHLGKLTTYGIIGYLLFILLITELSVMMAWIYSKSNGNMICMALFHLGVNISSILLLTEREGIMFYIVACAISTLICSVIVFADRRKVNVKVSAYDA